MQLLRAEIRRQLRRRGSIFGSIIFNGLFGLGLLLWVVFSHKDTGYDAITAGTGLLFFSSVISCIVIGAIAGSYDVDNGTMRYLVMTGTPRWQLSLVRAPALLVSVLVVTLPALGLVVVGGALAPDPAAAGHNYVDLFYGVWLSAYCFALLSLAIAAFLKSSAVAIAVAIVLNFAGALIFGAIGNYVSETLGKAGFLDVLGVAVQRHSDSASLSLGVSVAVLLLWLTVALAAATLRIQRAEY